MARKLASVVEIESCEPIPDTDRLSVATMVGKGWKVVTSRDEFKKGDLAVYFEIDSYLPSNDERYEFLRDSCLRKFVSKSGAVLKEGIRIKTIKLRGVISQGLLMPIGKFPEIESRRFKDFDGKKWLKLDPEQEGMDNPLVELVGADVTAILHVNHYDEIKEQLQPAMGNPISADAKGKFPSDYVPKTDEERIQNLGDWFETRKGRRWQVTCKHDGTSCTMAYSTIIDSENPEVVCSRNLRLKPPAETDKISVYWQMDEKYGVMGKLKAISESKGVEYALQGEIVGPGIQKCRNKESEHMFRVFRIYDITHQIWVNPNETVELCKSLEIPHVEIIKSDFKFFDEITTMDDALKFAEGKTAEGNEREWVVLKTIDSLPYASFKIVSNRYLMKQEDLFLRNRFKCR